MPIPHTHRRHPAGLPRRSSAPPAVRTPTGVTVSCDRRAIGGGCWVGLSTIGATVTDHVVRVPVRPVWVGLTGLGLGEALGDLPEHAWPAIDPGTGRQAEQ